MPRGDDAERRIRCCNKVGVHRRMRDRGWRRRPADPNPESTFKTVAGYRWEQANEIFELRLSVQLQFYFPVAGLFQPEFPGEISATRDRRHSRAGLQRDALGVGIAFVLLLSESRECLERAGAPA